MKTTSEGGWLLTISDTQKRRLLFQAGAHLSDALENQPVLQGDDPRPAAVQEVEEGLRGSLRSEPCCAWLCRAAASFLAGRLGFCQIRSELE